MMQEQKFIFPIQKQQVQKQQVQKQQKLDNRMQEFLSRRLLASALLALGLTLILVLLELGSLFLLSLGHPFVFPFSFFIGLLLLLIEFALLFLGAFLAIKPLAIVVYLRIMHQAQEYYKQLYIPLSSVTNAREAIVTDQERTALAASTQDEHVSILNLVEQRISHQVILGMPGAGKTMAMHLYQYQTSQKPFSSFSTPGKIPIYIPLKNYALFLKEQSLLLSSEDVAHEGVSRTSLLHYLERGDLPDIRYLRNYLEQLFRQGRLLLLCDGLDEVASEYFLAVSAELAKMMRDTHNHFVVTCREIDYRDQPDLVQLVDEGQAACAIIHSLQTDQIAEFVERYIERQDKKWRHTAGQIMSVIDHSRLRYHCTNPLMLFTLMSIIDKIGVERGKQIDTRGLLLREYVNQVLNAERKQEKWSHSAPTNREVISYLSEIACAARWANDSYAIQLPVASQTSKGIRKAQNTTSVAEQADELRVWLDAYPARAAFVLKDEQSTISDNANSQLLQFALDAALIDIGPDHVLSFRHELIAAYFVAEYLSRPNDSSTFFPRTELLENGEQWSEPVALWAGLLDEPLELAESLEGPDAQQAAFAFERLALSLVCVGVLWMPPQSDIRQIVVLPQNIEDALSSALQERDTRQRFAFIFTRYADKGAPEIYRSLLSLMIIEGADDFVTLLEQDIVLELLFTQLQDAIDDGIYEAQVKRIVRVLGRSGGMVVNRAAQLSLPASGRRPRLRAAVINVLGGTNDAAAVPPLIARLRDAEPFIVERATNALIRLGPALSLMRVLQEVESRASEPLNRRVHQATLLILERFMNEQDGLRQLSLPQYQSTIEHIVPTFTSEYQSEPEVQHQAQEIVVRQGQGLSGTGGEHVYNKRWDVLMDALSGSLSSQNEAAILNVTQVLQEIGIPVVPRLLDLLQSSTDNVRVHIIEVLGALGDRRALPVLLPLLADKSHAIQQRVAQALRGYAPESITGLINAVLHDPSDAVADRAAQVLVDIGQDVVQPVIDALPEIVPGRTRFLVQVLELVHDSGSIAALVSLLHTPQLEPLLVISIVRALGQFSDKRVVTPLLEVLATTNPQFYEEAVTALSQLGPVALEGLVAVLDTDHDSAIVQRVRRAILGMSPFPGEQLIQMLEQSTESQAGQILPILQMQGREGAAVLARHLLHPDEWLRSAIQQTLESMPGSIVVPALLAVVTQPALREVASAFLLNYPDTAIVPLVGALGEQERSAIAAALLPQFGIVILKPLIAGLDDQRSMARDSARRVLVDLVHQNQDQNEYQVLQEIVRLFGDPLPPRAREALMGALTNEFANISLPVLLEGLEDVHLIEAVAEVLARLVNRAAFQGRVLNALIEALGIEDRRSGSEIALIRIGAPAVARVGELITDRNPGVAKSAMHILSEIGIPALAFIWTAYSDRSNPPRREAARAIFRSMPPEVIKDELVSLLISKNREDIAMSVALLLERIDDETQLDYQYQVMVPELLDYIETHTVQETNLRISALLLLLGEQSIVDHLIQALDDNPQHSKQLAYMLLLLGPKTHALLLEVFADPNTNVELRADIAGMLSMLTAPDMLTNQVYKVSEYGLSSASAGALFSEQLALALRALGGLLVSGQWNPRKLMELRDAQEVGDPSYELFNVLLGWRYTPEIEKMQREMDVQRDMFKKELLALTFKLTEDQQRISSLETDLEKVRQEHGVRNDELQKTSHERDAMRANIEQLKSEKNKQQVTLEETTRKYNALLAQHQNVQKQLQGLSQGQGQAQGQTQGQGSASRPHNTLR